MFTVKKLLESKKKGFYTIAPDATAYEALQIMAGKDVGALLVVKEGSIVGIFTERDYARKVILKGKSSRETPVRDLMTTEVYCVTPEHSIDYCMALMNDKHVRHLPVSENGRLIGVVSIRDVVNTIIFERELTIQDLETYITGVTC